MTALAPNILHFVRLLRAAGLPLGSGQALAAAEAVALAGVSDRAALRQALFATLVTRRDQMALFDQAFELFWRDPKLADRTMAMLLPLAAPDSEPSKAAGARRLADALASNARPKRSDDADLELDMTLTASAEDVLRHKDFEQMSADEIARARALVARIPLDIATRPTRRRKPAAHGPRIDMRRTLRASLRGGGAFIDLKRAAPRERPPPIVALCDISGSMSRYARVFLHFLHALTEQRRRRGQRIESFVFGTRLTNATRALRHRDIDEALDRLGHEAGDWGGGTRIGAAIKAFNFTWARRVLGQGAVVLLITDGLDRDDPDVLESEAARLSRSCRELIWLNPLLRYAGFQPKAAGIRALMPHADRFLPLYNVATLADLAAQLAGQPGRPHLNAKRAA